MLKHYASININIYSKLFNTNIQFIIFNILLFLIKKKHVPRILDVVTPRLPRNSEVRSTTIGRGRYNNPACASKGCVLD